MVGLGGLIAGVALLRRLSWSVPTVATVAVLNLVGAVAALLREWPGAPIGLVLSMAALVLLAPVLRYGEAADR